MAEAKHGDWVQVHYTGRLLDGEIFDSSEGRDPLEFQLGAGQVIPGFEQAVVGLNTGESRTVNVPVSEAYGPHREEMVLVVEREKFPPDLNPEINQQLQLRQPNGQVFVAMVTAISDCSVTLDANHPLAGKDLVFDLRLIGISPVPTMNNSCGCDHCGTDDCGPEDCGSSGDCHHH